MRAMLCALFLVPGTVPAQQPGCAGLPDRTAIAFLGAFSNMRYTEEHAYGYTVQVWWGGGCLIGLFEASEGLAGDTPAGRLLVTKYDRRSGRLSFSARLTTGVVLDPKSRTEVPSRDEFEFEGILKRELLQGTLIRFDRLRPGSRATSESVSLGRQRDEGETLVQARTYREWKEMVEPILRFRGPKW